MPYSFDLPRRWKSQGWKAKIRGRERLEPPHVTVMFKTTAWRIGLRDFLFLDVSPDPSAVPAEIVAHLQSCSVRCAMAQAWDAMYPHNPVPVYDDCDACDDA